MYLRFLPVFLFLLVGPTLFGATCTTTSTTTWDCGTPGQNDDLIVNHSITITGDFTVNNGSITVNSPNTLTVTGNLTFNNNSTVLVNQGACIMVGGDLINKNNSGDIDIFGTLVVAGNFTNGEGSGMGAIINVGGTGTISIGGTCDNPGTVTSDTDSFTGCDNPILPVELVNFRATATEFGNLLQWETASERNNDFFEIQRSTNTRDWELIAVTEGNGNSDQLIAYEFLDANPIPGRNFYRLRQVDFDGAFEFSYIVSVITGQLPEFQIQKIYPNPFCGSLQVSYITNNDHPIECRLVDPMGKILYSGALDNAFGSNTFTLYLNVPDGFYLLQLQNQNLTLSHKLISVN